MFVIINIFLVLSRITNIIEPERNALLSYKVERLGMSSLKKRPNKSESTEPASSIRFCAFLLLNGDRFLHGVSLLSVKSCAP